MADILLILPRKLILTSRLYKTVLLLNSSIEHGVSRESTGYFPPLPGTWGNAEGKHPQLGSPSKVHQDSPVTKIINSNTQPMGASMHKPFF